MSGKSCDVEEEEKHVGDEAKREKTKDDKNDDRDAEEEEAVRYDN